MDNENKIGTSLVAQMLSISVRRVNQLAVEGKLPFEKLEGANNRFSRVFRKLDIERYKKERLEK